jgi:hypothetical protein
MAHSFISISKISINTGDELRARVTYVYENVDKAYDTVAVAKMPKIVEPTPPSFLNFYKGGEYIVTEDLTVVCCSDFREIHQDRSMQHSQGYARRTRKTTYCHSRRLECTRGLN